MKLLRRTLLLAAALACAGCALPPAAPVRLTVLPANHHHGRAWSNREGEDGLAAGKILVDAVRAEVAAAGGPERLQDAGAVDSGMPESGLRDAEPDQPPSPSPEGSVTPREQPLADCGAGTC
jgi:5'-nucleotidase/UDP-sugar diphosphatase